MEGLRSHRSSNVGKGQKNYGDVNVLRDLFRKPWFQRTLLFGQFFDGIDGYLTVKNSASFEIIHHRIHYLTVCGLVAAIAACTND